MTLELTRETKPWSVRVTVDGGTSKCFDDDHFIREYWTTIPPSHFVVPAFLAAGLNCRAAELGLTMKADTV